MRLSHERDHDVSVGGFVQQDLGVAGHQDLAPFLRRGVGEDLVGLALAQNLEVGIGLIEKHRGARVETQKGQQQQGLLHPSARRRQVEADAVARPVGHVDLSSLDDQRRSVELDTEQGPDSLGETLPTFVTIRALENLVAEIAKHLGRSTFAYPDVDRPKLEPGFVCGQAGHRREERDPDRPGLRRHRHAGRPLGAVQPQGTAQERLLVRIVELEAARPGRAVAYAIDPDVDTHVVGALTLGVAIGVADVEVAPQQPRRRGRNPGEVSATDRHARALLGRGLPTPLLGPAAKAQVPQHQRLQGRGLAGIVGPDEQDGIPELDLDLVEPLEVPNGDLREHRSSVRRWVGSARTGRCRFVDGPLCPSARGTSSERRLH